MDKPKTFKLGGRVKYRPTMYSHHSMSNGHKAT